MGQVTAYNDMLVHENEELRDEIRSLKGGRRKYHGDELDEGRRVKRRRNVPHSSSESEGNEEADDERARVRLNFIFKLIFFDFISQLKSLIFFL